LLAAGSGLAGALAVHACSVLDGVDGEVARLRQRAGPRGALLDGLLDRVTDAAVIAGLGLWALHEGASPPTVVVVVVAAAAGTILSMASKDRITALGLFPAPERALGWLAGGRDGRLMLIALFAALGRPMIALVAVAAASAATLLLRVVAVLRHAD
jgi:phosphatidylglycerophosphate synthase